MSGSSTSRARSTTPVTCGGSSTPCCRTCGSARRPEDGHPPVMLRGPDGARPPATCSHPRRLQQDRSRTMPTTVDEITSTIDIDAPIERVWAAITTPATIKQWFLGVDTETDWTVGSPIVHRGEYQGKPYVDKGTIRRFEPPRVLEHDHWSDGSGLPDEPENYQVVT